MTDLREVAKQMVLTYGSMWRAALHSFPETRWETPQTRAFIMNLVKNMIIARSKDRGAWHARELKGGIAVDYGASADVPRRLFRADFDALPIQEATGLEFSSRIDGKMHACGHDAHTAILLAAMKAIADGLVVPKGCLRFVFEDAEENPGSPPIPEPGGHYLIQDGVLDNIDEVYGLHLISNLPAGVFFGRSGALLGNSDRFGITIKASGGHVMEPHNGINSLNVAVDIANAFRTAGSRFLKPTDPHTVVLTGMRAGQGLASSNIMPADCELWFGVRTMLDNDRRRLFHSQLQVTAVQIAERYGAKVDCRPVYGHTATSNSMWNEVEPRLRKAGQEVREIEPQLGGESFGLFLQQRPGCFMLLGAGAEDKPGHHTPKFNLDESIFWQGVLYWLLLATEWNEL